MSSIEQTAPIWEIKQKRMEDESLQTGRRFDGPRPFDWAKALIDRRRENRFWPVTARDTDSAHGADVGFLGDIVVARAQRANDDRTIALLARKSRQMEIMRSGFQWAHEHSIPGHWRHRPGIHNRIIAQLGNFGHRALLCVRRRSAIHFEPAWLGAGPRGGPGAALKHLLKAIVAHSAAVSLPTIAHIGFARTDFVQFWTAIFRLRCHGCRCGLRQIAI